MADTTDYHLCDLCALNRATLHLDEVVEGALQMTAHLCDDCWFRLGIRVPLGNIWDHIQRHKKEMDLLGPVEEIIPDAEHGVPESDSTDDLGELLDPGSLAVAEPDEDLTDEPDSFQEEIEETLAAEGDRPARRDDLTDLDDLLDPVAEGLRGELGERGGLPRVTVESVHRSLVSQIPMEILVRCVAIPVKLEGAEMTVAIADPYNPETIKRLADYLEPLGLIFKQALADERDILRELERHRGTPPPFESLS